MLNMERERERDRLIDTVNRGSRIVQLPGFQLRKSQVSTQRSSCAPCSRWRVNQEQHQWGLQVLRPKSFQASRPWTMPRTQQKPPPKYSKCSQLRCTTVHLGWPWFVCLVCLLIPSSILLYAENLLFTIWNSQLTSSLFPRSWTTSWQTSDCVSCVCCKGGAWGRSGYKGAWWEWWSDVIWIGVIWNDA